VLILRCSNKKMLEIHRSAIASRTHLKSESMAKLIATIQPIETAPAMNAPTPAVVQDETTQISPAFRVRRDGELFLYVNDAAIGWPRFANFFYRGNEGEATVTLRHLPR
jgi:hypothetical protein